MATETKVSAMRCLLQLRDMGCVDVASHWRRTDKVTVCRSYQDGRWCGQGCRHYDAMRGRVVGPRHA